MPSLAPGKANDAINNLAEKAALLRLTTPNMQKLLDVLASGIHDSKNQLQAAESLIAVAERQHGIDLAEARYAIEAAANRLNRGLAAYRLFGSDAHIAMLPTVVADLCAEVALSQQFHLASAGLRLKVDCQTADEWPLDRDLVTDMLNNAIQNAARYARQEVHLSARLEDDVLCLRVEDDGPGFASLPPTLGTGLLVGQRLAELHSAHGQCGHLTLNNNSALGGACFELRLP